MNTSINSKGLSSLKEFWKNDLKNYDNDTWIGFCQKRRFWLQNNKNSINSFSDLNDYILKEVPNEWKLKIGATHERYSKNYDTNVQVQGLPGRMSGYWKDIILNGHKTGPHRTSIQAIKEYEEFYEKHKEKGMGNFTPNY